MRGDFVPKVRQVIEGALIIAVIGSLMHFAYDWSGQCALVGLVAPVDESVKEHLKMLFFPTLVWWIIMYRPYCRRYGFDEKSWITAGAVASIVAPLVVAAVFYAYTAIIGTHILLVDILLVPLGTLVGQTAGMLVLKYLKSSKLTAVIGILAVLAMCAYFII